LKKRVDEKMKKSTATMNNMSTPVPFVLSAHGRFEDKAVRLLDSMAARAFKKNLNSWMR